MTEEEITVIYYYRKKSTQVIVHYYEENTTTKLSEDVTINGKIDDEYRTTLINFGQSKYFIINFAMAKFMEMEQTDINKVALYLFNNIKIQ